MTIYDKKHLRKQNTSISYTRPKNTVVLSNKKIKHIIPTRDIIMVRHFNNNDVYHRLYRCISPCTVVLIADRITEMAVVNSCLVLHPTNTFQNEKHNQCSQNNKVTTAQVSGIPTTVHNVSFTHCHVVLKNRTIFRNVAPRRFGQFLPDYTA
jgi:hypothetical protein